MNKLIEHNGLIGLSSRQVTSWHETTKEQEYKIAAVVKSEDRKLVQPALAH